MTQEPDARFRALPSDLTPYARIRNAALEGFAARGIAATSIRDVAAAADVSPGLVQHHFGTKDGLRDAVNEYVIAVATDTLQDLVTDAGTPEGWVAMGDVVTGWVRDNAVALRYLGRALVEGDAEAAKIFDALVGIAHSYWVPALARDQNLDPDIDQDWAAIHVIVFNLATVLLESAINRQLPEPLFTPEQLQRWNVATTELYRRGFSPQYKRRTQR